MYNSQHLTLQMYNTMLSADGDKEDYKEARRELAEFVVNTCLCLCNDDGGATEEEEPRLHFVAPAAVQDQMNGVVKEGDLVLGTCSGSEGGVAEHAAYM